MTPIKVQHDHADLCQTIPQNTRLTSASLIDQIAAINRAITVPELSKLLHLGRTAIYDLVKRQAIPYIRIGYNVRFDPTGIAEWLRSKSSSVLPRTPIR